MTARLLLLCAITAVLSVAVGCGGGGMSKPAVGATAAPVKDYPYPVQYFPDITPPLGSGMRHLTPGETFVYNSNPPTNGKHTSETAPAGVSGVPVPKETAVHNMEHGGVVVWVNCAGGPHSLSDADCTALRDQLGSIVERAARGGKSVLMTVYDGMPHRIALTAWQFLDAFDDFDKQRVQTFIDSFLCHTDIEGYCR